MFKPVVIHGVCDCKATYWTGLASAYKLLASSSKLPPGTESLLLLLRQMSGLKVN